MPVTEAEIDLMNKIDAVYTDLPFYGTRRIKQELWKRYRLTVNRKCIRRLMKHMGLEAIYPKKKPNTSNPNNQHRTYPYLLNNLIIDRPNQVWGTDITYVRLAAGFAYLVAIMDWFSRYVVAWEICTSLEIDFVARNLEKALRIATPEYHNSDQGSHFTSPQYTAILQQAPGDIRISMDSKGRCMDNIFTERLWRTVKYENIYLKSYATVQEARAGLTEYFDFYNFDRSHSSLDDLTPSEVYFNKITNKLAPALTI